MIHGSIPSFTDAFFEMMSGYTTTGATILTDIEALPHGLLFWRSETHLLGGMGFLTLIILFLPKGMGGLRLFRAESSPGQSFTGEKFAARTKDTMVRLWIVYLGLNLLQVILLAGGGMELFDALCTAFGTLSTSGYSPKNTSIGFYNNAYFDWVIIVFMFLGGTSFVLLYHMMYGGIKEIVRNTEFKWYAFLIVFFCLAVSMDPLAARHLFRHRGLCSLRHLSGDVPAHHHRLRHSGLRAMAALSPDVSLRFLPDRRLRRLDQPAASKLFTTSLSVNSSGARSKNPFSSPCPLSRCG